MGTIFLKLILDASFYQKFNVHRMPVLKFENYQIEELNLQRLVTNGSGFILRCLCHWILRSHYCSPLISSMFYNNY